MTEPHPDPTHVDETHDSRGQRSRRLVLVPLVLLASAALGCGDDEPRKESQRPPPAWQPCVHPWKEYVDHAAANPKTVNPTFPAMRDRLSEPAAARVELLLDDNGQRRCTIVVDSRGFLSSEDAVHFEYGLPPFESVPRVRGGEPMREANAVIEPETLYLREPGS